MILAYSCRLEAGEWNEKPVMCADEKETFEAIYRKKEILIFTGLEYAKVRPEDGYKVIEAERLAAKNKIDPFSVKDPNALIQTYVDHRQLKSFLVS